MNGHKIVDGSTLQVAVSEDQLRERRSARCDSQRNASDAGPDGGAVPRRPGSGEQRRREQGGSAKTGKLGLAVSNLTDARQQINVPDERQRRGGADCASGQPGRRRGLQPGDVIMEVNRKPADSAEPVRGRGACQPGREVTVDAGMDEGRRELHRSQSVRRQPERDVRASCSRLVVGC